MVDELVCKALFSASIHGFISEERLVGVCRHQVKGWWQDISVILLKSRSHLSCRQDMMLLCRFSTVCMSTECGSVTCSAQTLAKQSVLSWWKRPQVTNVEAHTSYMFPGE